MVISSWFAFFLAFVTCIFYQMNLRTTTRLKFMKYSLSYYLHSARNFSDF